MPDHFSFGASSANATWVAADVVRMLFSLSKNTTIIFNQTLTGNEY